MIYLSIILNSHRSDDDDDNDNATTTNTTLKIIMMMTKMFKDEKHGNEGQTHRAKRNNFFPMERKQKKIT